MPNFWRIKSRSAYDKNDLFSS